MKRQDNRSKGKTVSRKTPKAKSNKRILWIVLGILALVGGFVLYQIRTNGEPSVPVVTSTPDYSPSRGFQVPLNPEDLNPGTTIIVGNGFFMATNHPAVNSLELGGQSVEELYFIVGYTVLQDRSMAFFIRHESGQAFCVDLEVEVEAFSYNVEYVNPDGSSGILTIRYILPGGNFCTGSDGQMPLQQA